MKGSFLRGTLMLALAGFISRGVGAIYRILLPRFIGAEGVGLFHMAYYVYALALFLMMPGIPLAMSRLIARAESRGLSGDLKKILQAAFLILLIMGVILAFAVYLGADKIARVFFNDPRVAFPLMAVAPALFFVSLIAFFRGYFQGMNTMIPTALSQVVEQVARIVVMLLLLYYILEGPVQGLAAGAALATVCGEFAGLICIMAYFLRNWPHKWWRSREAAISLTAACREIFSHALPLGLGALAIPLIGLLNSAIIPRRLQTLGYTSAEATALFGQFSGMAMVLFFFPLILTTALAISLVPEVSQALARGDISRIQRRTNRAITLTMQTTIPAAVGYIVLGRDICELLFGYPLAGEILAYLAPSLMFIGLQLALSGVLQGMGYVSIPVQNLVIGAVVNGILTYILTAQVGIIGAGLATATGFTLAGILNVISTGRIIGLSVDARKQLILPLTGSFSMGFLVMGTNLLLQPLGMILCTLVPIAAGGFYYFFFMLFFRGFEPADIELIPLIGSKLVSWIQ